jgi:hypothetical protein
MMKKSYTIGIVAVLFLACFAGIAIQPASADTIWMNVNDGDKSFDHDLEVDITSSWTGSGVTGAGARYLCAYLIRTVEWSNDTDYGDWFDIHDDAHNVVIKNVTWLITGYMFSGTFQAEFTDTLNLAGLRWNQPSYPNQWTDVHWVVGYRVEWKWADDNDLLLATTGACGSDPAWFTGCICMSTYIGHDEVTIVDSCDGGSYGGELEPWADVYDPTDIEGPEDNCEGAIYGYNQGACGFLTTQFEEAPRDDWQIVFPPQEYDLYVKMHDWDYQPMLVRAWSEDWGDTGAGSFIYDSFSGWWDASGTVQFMGEEEVNYLASTWINFGQLQLLSERIYIVALCYEGSGIVWIDSIQYVPHGSGYTI